MCLAFMAMTIISVTGCSRGARIPGTTSIHDRQNAVYYWRTSFVLTEDERAFLKREQIGRLYLRMFDVTEGEYTDMALPNATLTFGMPVPDSMEIVPTVFVTVEALRQMANADQLDVLAEKIVKRVEAMCSWNDIENWNEIQLDCDWTESTRDAFYILCSETKKKLGGRRLSCTIRLHQLAQKAPPVDYGVLMVYNTDRFDDINVENSILNSSTVEQYLNKKLDFRLPLDVALPIYQWDLVFRGEKFDRIARGWYEDIDSTETIRHEQVPTSELQKTQELLNRYLHLESSKHSTVLYHLDSTNVNNYNHEDIKSIYNN